MSDVLGGGEIGQALAVLEPAPIPDIIADRYATPPMKKLWSPEGYVVVERHLQVAVMEAQAHLGVDIPPDHIEDYRRVIDDIDLAEMRAEEAKSKHDVNARIKVFNKQAGHQDVGLGMTSRDHTDNSEQYQKKRGLEIMHAKAVAGVVGLAEVAVEYESLPITGRTHNVPAEMTTLGKRFANTGEELVDGLRELELVLKGLKLRGIKGAVGTQQAMLDLFGGDEYKVDELDLRLMRYLGFSDLYDNTGQIYPRSEDLRAVHALSAVVTPMSNFATNVRGMMGLGLLTETKEKRVGSNAMPHKINPRTSERVVGSSDVLSGYETMLRSKVDEQWAEGDVSDSIIRRIALPGSFLMADGAYEAGLQVVNGFGVFRAAIAAEVDANLPFLATSKVLTAAITRGMGREDAHEIIRGHAFDVVTEMREKGRSDNNLLERLGDDPAIPLNHTEIAEAVENPIDLAGRASTQVQRFTAKAQEIADRYPEAATYKPGAIL